MSVVQATYPNFHGAFYDGQFADTTTFDADSYLLIGDEAVVPFGRAVSYAATATNEDNECVAYAGSRFAGIAIVDERLPASSGGRYAEGDLVTALFRGDVAVKVSAAVAIGDDVVISTAASGAMATVEEIGQLSSKAADGTHIALTGARFITSAAAQGIAIVRLGGSAPV